MDKLVLHPTDMSQWYALVNEAQLLEFTQLDEELESYLVFTLMRFTEQPELLSGILAIEFLEGINESSDTQRFEILRNLGDKSLMIAGFFTELANRRRVSADYYSQMGKQAYNTIAHQSEITQQGLYVNLSCEFDSLSRILSRMRSFNH